MELKFLGTSSGTPTRQRNVTGLAIKRANSKSWRLVDCGESTQHQLLATNLTLKNLHSVYITHMHGDHCYGLPGLLASASMGNREAPLPVIGPAVLREVLDVTLRNSEVELSFELQFIEVEQLSEPLSDNEFAVAPIELSHRIPSFGYIFTETNVHSHLDAEKLRRDGVPPGPSWKQLQLGEDVEIDGVGLVRAANYRLAPRPARRVIIGGDNDKPELLGAAAHQAEVVVHESTYTEEVLQKIGPRPQHSSAQRVARFAEEAQVKNLVLTHFSPRYRDPPTEGGASIEEVEQEARRFYTGQLYLARDFDRYQLDARGALRKIES